MRRAIALAAVSALAWRAWQTAMASVGTPEAPNEMARNGKKMKER